MRAQTEYREVCSGCLVLALEQASFDEARALSLSLSLCVCVLDSHILCVCVLDSHEAVRCGFDVCVL